MSSDEERMLAAQRGDQRAFGELYEKFKGPLMSYLFGIVRSRTTAEEILHEVFLKAYRARATYVPSAKVSTWLWTIARNFAFDHLRLARVQREVLLAPELDSATPPSAIENFESNIPDIETELVERSESERVRQCIDKLPEAQRDALLLRTVSELSYEEIADCAKTSLSSVKSLIFRAKGSLVRCLEMRGAA